MGAVSREGDDRVSHIAHIVAQLFVLIRIVQNLVDEVDARLRACVDLLGKVSFNQSSQALLALDGIEVYHFLLLLKGQSGRNMSNRKIVAQRHFAPQAAVAVEYLDLNVVRIDA